MLKYIIQKEKKYNGQTYRERKIIADELYLKKLVKVPEVIVYSSWRSLEEQKKLVAEGKSKTLQSNHRRGMACDLVNWSECQDKMRSVGLINDISWDRNHFAYDGETEASKYPIYDEANNLTQYNIMIKEFVKAVEKLTGKEYGDALNEKEQKDAGERLLKFRSDSIFNYTDAQRELKDALEVKNEALVAIEKLNVKVANQTEMLVAKDKQIEFLKKAEEGETLNQFDLGNWRFIIKKIIIK